MYTILRTFANDEGEERGSVMCSGQANELHYILKLLREANQDEDVKYYLVIADQT